VSDPLAVFGPATQTWFRQSFAEPTAVQRRGWTSIAAGHHTLMLAPTGSGKTLAAFLWCLDQLAHRPPAAAGDAEATRVVYVSPIKALAYDIERNLRAPLAGLQRLGAGGQITVDVRTGDTPAKERERQRKHPAQILITTPESLYLLLAGRSRERLRGVETIIVDEIHALAPTKRGVHLALSLERLCHLVTGAGQPEPQRIGLSATQRPLVEVARYLGGDRPVEIVDASARPAMDLAIIVPAQEMDHPGTAGRDGGGMWPLIYPRLLEMILAHRTTIIFVNSRRLAERVSQQLTALAAEAGQAPEGSELVRAHHGSVSRHQRLEIEEALKGGRLRAIAATSSLELGIDMGTVDLVIQVESPGSVSRGLQRIGRAGHHVGGVSIGRIVPKFRGDLLEATVVAQQMLEGEVEPIRVPDSALDVLAQQIVAMVAVDAWRVDDLERLIHRTASYRELSRGALTGVLDMLAGRYPSDEFAELRPRLTWDRQTDVLVGRKGARLLSVMSGGTIPDRGTYAVHLGSGPRIGELDEEMVAESRKGETFLLGATTWRIEDITRDRVIVSPAPGEPGKMPFWRGEGPGRPIELGRALGAFCRELDGRLAHDPAGAHAWLTSALRLDGFAADNLIGYLGDQRAQTGAVPTDRAITIERFRDELGDVRVCILSPFGSRVHAPWSLVIARQLEAQLGYPVHPLYTDDGIALRFADGDELPTDDQLVPDPDEVEAVLIDELARSSVFASHFRENAARALLLPRRRPGQRTPLWAQRLRAQQLMGVALRFPAFPITLETYREVLRDVFDLPALIDVLRQLRSRAIRIEPAVTEVASPFARSLVFDYVAAFLYEGDAPLAERKAQALTLDRNLLRELIGGGELRDLLDPDVLDEVEAELQQRVPDRQARSADELHDVLRRLGDLSTEDLAARAVPELAAVLGAALAGLLASRRIAAVRIAGTARYIAAEDAARYRDGLGVQLPPGLPAALLEPVAQPLETLVARWARTHAPFTAAEPAARWGLPPAQIEPVLGLLEARTQLVRGLLRPGGTHQDSCDPEVLRQLRRRTLGKLRAQVAPVGAAAFAAFLPRWHGLDQPRRGLGALRDAIGRLEGVALPFSELEARILPARILDYHPRMLDELGAAGELVWVGAGALGARDGRVILLRRDRAIALAPEPQAVAHERAARRDRGAPRAGRRVISGRGRTGGRRRGAARRGPRRAGRGPRRHRTGSTAPADRGRALGSGVGRRRDQRYVRAAALARPARRPPGQRARRVRRPVVAGELARAASDRDRPRPRPGDRAARALGHRRPRHGARRRSAGWVRRDRRRAAGDGGRRRGASRLLRREPRRRAVRVARRDRSTARSPARGGPNRPARRRSRGPARRGAARGRSGVRVGQRAGVAAAARPRRAPGSPGRRDGDPGRRRARGVARAQGPAARHRRAAGRVDRAGARRRPAPRGRARASPRAADRADRWGRRRRVAAGARAARQRRPRRLPRARRARAAGGGVRARAARAPRPGTAIANAVGSRAANRVATRRGLAGRRARWPRLRGEPRRRRSR